jgi:hypothetical protein
LASYATVALRNSPSRQIQHPIYHASIMGHYHSGNRPTDEQLEQQHPGHGHYTHNAGGEGDGL